MTTLALTIIVLAAAALAAHMLLAIRKEKALWNGGVSTHTHEPWQLANKDPMDGSRRYVSGSESIWLSYGVDNFDDEGWYSGSGV